MKNEKNCEENLKEQVEDNLFYLERSKSEIKIAKLALANPEIDDETFIHICKKVTQANMLIEYCEGELQQLQEDPVYIHNRAMDILYGERV